MAEHLGQSIEVAPHYLALGWLSSTRQTWRSFVISGLALLSVAAACLTSTATNANPLKSLYTTIELKSCKQIKRHPDGGAWLCPGLEGYPVYVAEGDLRTFVSVGPSPERRRAANQTLKSFNSLFRGRSNRATLEWRFVRKNGQPVPYATIQRYFTKSDTASGEVLVVTKVSPTEDCHVAHVDALATPNAIAVARRIADDEARSFDCKRDPKSAGTLGKSPM